MESKKINQLATSVNPSTSDLAIIGDPITGVSKKITWLQVSSLIGTAANLQQVTDNGATTTNPITIGGLTISGLSTGVLKSDSGVISSVPFGGANGVATLGGDGKVPSSQLPSYVDDVVEVANFAALPVTGETGKIYITLDNNKVYRWTGSTYVEIAANNAVWGAITGTLSNQTDLQNALNAKVPTTRTLTINGTTYDLSADRAWTITAGISGSGTTNYIPKFTGSTALGNSLIFDDGTNVGIGTATPTYKLSVAGTTAISGQLTLGSTITNGTYTYTLPSATGTLAIRSDLDAYVTLGTSQVITGAKVFDGSAAFSSTGGVLGIEGGASVYKGLALAKGFPPSIFVTGFSTLYSASGNNNAVFNDNSNTSKLQFQGTSSYTYTFPANTGTIALTSDIPVNSITSVTATSPLFSSGGLTPNITIQVANTSQNGYLSSTDWNTFNGKQNALTNPITGTGVSGRIPYFNGTTTQTSTSNLTWDNTGNFISTSGVYVYNTSTNAYMLTSNGDNIGSVFNVSATRWGLGYGSSTSSLATAVLSWNDSGNVSIGNTNNTYKLDVTGTGRFTTALTIGSTESTWGLATSNRLQLNNSVLAGYGTTGTFLTMNLTYNSGWKYISTGNACIYSQEPGEHTFYTSSSGTAGAAATLNERMRITNAGNVGIGTGSPSYILDVQYGGNISQRIRNTAAGGTATLLLETANTFSGTSQAYVQCIGTAGGGQSQLTFGTAGASGDSSATERMRITSGGSVLIGASTTTGVAKFEVTGAMYAKGGDSVIYFDSQNTSVINAWYASSAQVRLYNNGYGIIGYFTESNGAYTAASDYNMKKNIVDSNNALDIVSKIKVRSYDWKATDIHEPFGVIAQELYEVAPTYVSQPIDNDSKWGVSKAEMVPMLIKAIQELEARLKTLENK
jgi:hypothetical protein